MSKKKRKGKKKGLNKRQLRNMILEVLEKEPQKTFNYKQVGNILRLNSQNDRRFISEQLMAMESEGFITSVRRGSFKANQKAAKIEGKIQLTRRGPATLICNEEETDIIVPQVNLNHALHNDIVEVFVYAKRRGIRQAEVVKIVKRAKEQFVGNIQLSNHYAFMIPDNSQMPYDIFIPMNYLNGAKNGDKVISRIDDWPKEAKNPIGKVIEVLGKPGENNTEMHAILAEFELPHKFPQSVLDAANQVSDEMTTDEIKKRMDFRDVLTFTIDPVDAKDFDDALSIQQLKNGNWEIGVHIADVTHYVKPGSVLDKEAFNRATSVYLVDRVVPMLPERLSNELCSLRPNEDKFTYSVIFEMDDKASVLSYKIGRTIINSDHRFAYEEAQEMIETGKGVLAKEINYINGLAKVLRDKRFNDGSINFDRHEVKFHLDKEGAPTGVYFKISKDANHLIEEFMLLANRTVAEHIEKMNARGKRSFIYRIHDKPDASKLHHLADFVKRFGYKINTSDTDKIASSLNSMIEDSKDKPHKSLIEVLAVRSMAKAIYSSYNIGHYGLAFDHYSHFTSPIRRYPDMIAHRLIAEYMNGANSVQQSQLEKQCDHCSEMEQRAVQAERASIKYKQVEFMQEHLGEEFSGIVSGVTHWGIFVEIEENGCEGMVSLQSLDDDYYVFDDKEMAIIGQKTNRKIQLGDEVKVQVAAANLIKKQLDFELID